MTAPLPQRRTPGNADRALPRNVDPLFADIWAEARSRGWDQATLADASGVSRGAVSALVTGRHGMTTATARAMATALGRRWVLVPEQPGAVA